ncbi:enoyl-CoA hydratase-related protein [Sphingobium sp. MK2]|uniref:enoyl-CoA hydratase-related protein n=1 Tax=Sphingobium sp. MK2 TaxID=3116540 RepID=UPI0032E35AAD
MEIDGAVATIKLVRSGRLNAFDRDMHLALAGELDAVASNADVKVLILTGEGRAFSSGQDLQERAAAFADGDMPDIHGSLETFYNPLITRLTNLSIPVIAAVNGMAFGAGAAVAIACDITIAAQSARFQFGFVNVGLGPDSGASWTLPRLVGLQRAMDLALSGRAIDAREAERIGLVARCVDDAQLMAEAGVLARQLAEKSAPALLAIKARLRGAAVTDLVDALAAERDAQVELGQTPEYREAVLRFAARSRS